MTTMLDRVRPYVKEFWKEDDAIECSCGGWAEAKLVDITYSSHGKEIMLRHVPVYVCSECEEVITSAYVNVRVEELLAYALKHALLTLDFTE